MRTQASRPRSLRGIASAAACAALVAAALSGCASEFDARGGSGGVPTASPAPGDVLVDADGENAEDDTRGDTFIAGTVALSWTGGDQHQNFVYNADHCYVGDDYVLVEATGTAVDSSGKSVLNIFTTPEELLHAETATFQAEGIVQFSWSGAQIVADGRQILVGGNPQPAVFTYRQSGSSVKYVVGWFEGANDAGAGAVEVTCNY